MSKCPRSIGWMRTCKRVQNTEKLQGWIKRRHHWNDKGERQDQEENREGDRGGKEKLANRIQEDPEFSHSQNKERHNSVQELTK